MSEKSSKLVNIEFELKLLKTICNTNNDQIRDVILGYINPEHFGFKPARVIFNRILSGYVKKGKAIPRIDVMKHDGYEEHEMLCFQKMEEGSKSCKSVGDVEVICNDLDALRRARLVLKGIKNVSNQFISKNANLIVKNLPEIISILESTTLVAKEEKESDHYLKIGMGSNYKDFLGGLLSKDKPQFLRSGFEAFDEVNGGFKRGNLVVLASVSSGGKSIMGCCMGMYNYMVDHKNVVVYSFEMQEEEYFERIAANLAEINHQNIRLKTYTKKERKQIRIQLKEFNKIGEENNCSFTVYTPTKTIAMADIRQKMKIVKPDMIILDYLNLIASEQNSDSWEKFGEITADAKRLATETKSTVVLLCQLDEDTLKVKYSKAIKHHADFLWKWDFNDENRYGDKPVKVIQDKGRSVEIFPFNLKPMFKYMKFINLPFDKSSLGSYNKKNMTIKSSEGGKKNKDGDSGWKNINKEKKSKFMKPEDDINLATYDDLV